MPAVQIIDNEFSLFALRLSGTVTVHQLTDVLAEFSATAVDGGGYHVLLIFDHDVDLSQMNTVALATLQNMGKTVYRKLHVVRLAGAAVQDGSADAKLILPLWNALCQTDSDIDLTYKLFDRLEPALAWLGIPDAQDGLLATISTQQLK